MMRTAQMLLLRWRTAIEMPSLAITIHIVWKTRWGSFLAITKYTRSQGSSRISSCVTYLRTKPRMSIACYEFTRGILLPLAKFKSKYLPYWRHISLLAEIAKAACFIKHFRFCCTLCCKFSSSLLRNCERTEIPFRCLDVNFVRVLFFQKKKSKHNRVDISKF